ncbi:hypothetical protein A0H81_03510 [Grifola frondosa]|uniref:DUF6534 domain-containing protein n=1 Tax=Grifola frondosa TaxID=5627 RepID=A0A1C7MIB1_GRIFR|nr:hypothetical protein A0H81_03510 [Grifola frondosa]
MSSPIKLDNTLGAIFLVKDFTDLLALSAPTWSIVGHIVVEMVLNLIEFGPKIGTSVAPHSTFGINGVATKHQRLPSNGKSLTFTALIQGILNAPHSAKVGYIQLANIAWVLYLSFSAGLAADIIVAVSLCCLLAKHRTGFKRSAFLSTDSIIRVLMLYSINTCVLTTVFAFCCLITVWPFPFPPPSSSSISPNPQFIMMPDELICLGFYFVLPKLYLNSFLAMLNSRKHMREIGSSTPVMSIPLSAMSGTCTAASAGRAGGKSQYEDQSASKRERPQENIMICVHALMLYIYIYDIYDTSPIALLNSLLGKINKRKYMHIEDGAQHCDHVHPAVRDIRYAHGRVRGQRYNQSE